MGRLPEQGDESVEQATPVMDIARTGLSTAQVVAYVALAAGLSATGNLIIKNAARSMGGLNLSGGHLAQTLFHLFTNPGIILGLALYLVGFVLWAKVLATVDISLAYPIFVSLAFVIVVMGSRIFFSESLNPIKILGIAVIALGIIVVSRG
jgi:multidrug transporter EmrE-like cation transporter